MSVDKTPHACASCGDVSPAWDMYLTTEQHRMGEGRWLCPHCAAGMIR